MNLHELAVLRHIVKTVNSIAEQNGIAQVKNIVLEVGSGSTYVPMYLHKLFPAAADSCPRLQNAKLITNMVSGRGLTIKEIGY